MLSDCFVSDWDSAVVPMLHGVLWSRTWQTVVSTVWQILICVHSPPSFRSKQCIRNAVYGGDGVSSSWLSRVVMIVYLFGWTLVRGLNKYPEHRFLTNQGLPCLFAPCTWLIPERRPIRWYSWMFAVFMVTARQLSCELHRSEPVSALLRMNPP